MVNLMIISLLRVCVGAQLADARSGAPKPPAGFTVRIQEADDKDAGRLKVTFLNLSDKPVMIRLGDEGSFDRIWVFDLQGGGEPPLTELGKKRRLAFKNWGNRDHTVYKPILPGHQFSYTEFYLPSELYQLSPGHKYIAVLEWWDQSPGGISVVSTPIDYYQTSKGAIEHR